MVLLYTPLYPQPYVHLCHEVFSHLIELVSNTDWRRRRRKNSRRNFGGFRRWLGMRWNRVNVRTQSEWIFSHFFFFFLFFLSSSVNDLQNPSTRLFFFRSLPFLRYRRVFWLSYFSLHSNISFFIPHCPLSFFLLIHLIFYFFFLSGFLSLYFSLSTSFIWFLSVSSFTLSHSL